MVSTSRARGLRAPCASLLSRAQSSSLRSSAEAELKSTRSCLFHRSGRISVYRLRSVTARSSLPASKGVSLRLFHLDPGVSTIEKDVTVLFGGRSNRDTRFLGTTRARLDISVLTFGCEFRVDRPTTRDHRFLLRLARVNVTRGILNPMLTFSIRMESKLPS